MPRVLSASTLLLMVLLISACTYTGGIDNPVARKFSWFSYLGGDDIRRLCTKGADRYRFVYNADYEEQVRAYDLRPSATGTGAVLWGQIVGAPNLVGTAGFAANDLLAPWRGTSTRKDLSEADYRALLKAVDDGAFAEPPPAGLQLNSWGFYWVASACVDGRFLFNAAAHPSPRFAALRFPEMLARHDLSGIPWNPRRAVAPEIGGQPAGRQEDLSRQYFLLRAGPGGLNGQLTLF